KQTKNLVMADRPIANFSIPAGLICTNQELIFENTSTVDANLDFAWEWYLDGLQVSSDENLIMTFSTPSASPQSIALKAETGVVACNSEIAQNVGPVPAGPMLSFSVEGNCVSDSFKFTNTTTDPINTS